MRQRSQARELGAKVRAEWMTGWAPLQRTRHDVTNGRAARDLPVASALLIRQDIAHFAVIDALRLVRKS
jgi:hypothetical protein